MRRSVFMMLIAVVAMVLSSCCDDKCTEPDVDPPVVTIDNVNPGDEITGIRLIQVSVASTNETDIVLVLDGEELYREETRGYHYFNSNDFFEGNHSLKAKATDSEGNEGFSDTIQIYTRHDFAPYSNGELLVSVNYYEQLDEMDNYSEGDPYFVFELYIDGEEFGTYVSDALENTAQTDSTFSCSFDVSDTIHEYTLTVYAMDADAAQDDEIMDYTADSETNYTTFVLQPVASDFSLFYSGEDDGSGDLDDNDCVIQLTVETITE